MIGFGQGSCGNEPLAPDSFKDFKKFKLKHKIWESCMKEKGCDELISAAELLYKNTDYIEAEKKLDLLFDRFNYESEYGQYSLCEITPSLAYIYLQYADVLKRKYYYVRAITYYKKYIELKPADTQGYVGLNSCKAFISSDKSPEQIEIRRNEADKRKADSLRILYMPEEAKKEAILNPKKKTTDSWSGNGSGFFISKSGYIATNYHVIDGASEIEVEFKYKNEIKGFNAKVIKFDKTNDLAIIKIDDSNFFKLSEIPYNFRTRSIDVGSEVFALGYPMALSLMGKDIKFTDGKISSKTGLGGDITTYQIQVPIQPGNSGGPLFDFKGNLIGITSSGINRKLDLTENVNYAIKSSYLLNLIDVLPESIELPSSKELASKPLTEQIKVLSDYVVLIKVK